VKRVIGKFAPDAISRKDFFILQSPSHNISVFGNLKNYHIKIRSSNQEKKICRRVLHLRKQFVDEKVALLRQNILSQFQFVKLIF
jgi:hypothetical protein